MGRRWSVPALLVLRTLMVFDAVLLVLVGAIAALLGSSRMAWGLSILAWLGAAALTLATKWADRLYDRSA